MQKFTDEENQKRLNVRVPPADPSEPQLTLFYASEEYTSHAGSWKRRHFRFTWRTATPALAASGVAGGASMVGIHTFPGHELQVMLAAIATAMPSIATAYGLVALYRYLTRRRTR